jgi:dihydroflavonol-4-reductase
MSKTTVLVTGATGFIAGHCIEELLSNGYAVRGTVRDLAGADVAHLRAIAERTGGSLEFAQASLDADAGWAEAMRGCACVWHLASPNPPSVPDDAEAMVRTAVEGTRRVLAAAAGAGVLRVVMTSSTDAVTSGHQLPDSHVFTEADWTDPQRSTPYPRSKVEAEKAAWALAADASLELVTINPGLVLGPLQRPQRTTSIEVVRKLMARELPAVPEIGFSVVDVRDVATAHRLAMEAEAAAGNRYICAGEFMWMGEIAAVLADALAVHGFKVPTRRMPRWLMRIAARFDKTVALALTLVGRRAQLSTAKARAELGWSARPARESILGCSQSLIRFDPTLAAASR